MTLDVACKQCGAHAPLLVGAEIGTWPVQKSQVAQTAPCPKDHRPRWLGARPGEELGESAETPQ